MTQDRTPDPVEAESHRPDVDEMFRRLDDEVNRVTEAEATADSLRSIASDAGEQADQLLALATAQKDAQSEAQKIIGAAHRERDRSAAKAAKLLTQAKEAAARLQAEAEARATAAEKDLAGWAEERRRAIDIVVDEMREAAEDDAARMRSDAQREAMEQARTVSRSYVTRAVDLATQEAERHRAEARDVLATTDRTVRAARDTLAGFAEQLTGFVTAMSAHLDELEEVSTLASARHETAEQAAPVELDDSWELDEDAVAAAMTADDLVADEAPDAPSDVADATVDAAPADDDGAGASDQTDATDESDTTDTTHEGDADQDGESTQDDADGRPLGSLFRGPQPQPQPRRRPVGKG